MTTETMTRARFLETVAPWAVSPRGARMGRVEWPAATIDNRGRYPGETPTGPTRQTLAAIPRRFYLRALELDSGGYDAGGAYWGADPDGLTLYAAVAPSTLATLGGREVELDWARFYVRAATRDHAKRDIVARYPGALFFDGPRGPALPAGGYAVSLEWVGETSPRWVVRFRGEWVGHAATLEGAETMAETHAAAWPCYWWTDSTGQVEIMLPAAVVEVVATSGDNGPAVVEAVASPFIAGQLKGLDPATLEAVALDTGLDPETLASVGPAGCVLWIACHDVGDAVAMGEADPVDLETVARTVADLAREG